MNQSSRKVRLVRGPTKGKNHNDSVLPYPTKLPSDPPEIKLNVAREVTIPLSLDVTAGLKETLTHSALVTGIQKYCFSATTATFKYNIIRVACWGSMPRAQVTLTDALTGVIVHDTGSAAFRPKVGITYPPNIQAAHFYDEGTSSKYADYSSSIDDAEVEIRVTVRYWST
jgi:hypothetical protein